MKKIMKKVTATISAAIMCAVPMINGVTANAAKPHSTDYLDGRNYYREVWVERTYRSNFHSTYLVGDANLDNKITLADALCISQHIQNKNKPICYYAADVDGNGSIDSYDVYLVQAWDAGQIGNFADLQDYYKKLKNYNPSGTYRVYSNDGYNTFSAVLIGDINNDGKVKLNDALMLSQCLNNNKGYRLFYNDEENLTRVRRAGDINNDGRVNTQDVDLICSIDAGVRQNFDEFV